MYVIEYQKRGLPHVYILLIMADNDEPGISKEKKEQRSHLQDIVVTNMIHGPCGCLHPTTDCMHDGKCKKFFPKVFQAHTMVDTNCTYASIGGGLPVIAVAPFK